ncbi:hypothetical protein C5F50_01110 [Nitrosopumilus ureiphilus]|uniref:Uncharacterized protein n=1 Tax=Nitrosopumilus ureiphilus TaxID=1470067 RepID=A0A7D5RHC3_9ARCH|nr:hypothetical protein C5F50_01110 [Nitrosopumilus ureiphilus]
MLLVSGLVPYASAAQLDAAILSEKDFVEPSFQFLRVIYIEYPNDGEISESLRNTKQTLSFVADHSTPGTDELVKQINQNLKTISSSAVVTDVKIQYQAILQGNEHSAVIEYKVQLIPTITNHILEKSFEKSTVDANWRGISLDVPIILQTEYGSFDVNNPKSALNVMMPEISEKLNGVTILELPLIDASGIMTLPLHKWHSLFDNTAIMSDAIEYNYAGKNVITHYSMGECSIEVGMCNDREWIQEIELDKKYVVKIIESSDDATISFEGYVDTIRVNGNEVFQTNLKSLVIQKPDTDEFPATVMYGMAGIAAIGAVVMFVISDRKLKKDKDEGQTGVDPAHLKSYETSSSAGSYKTNRGESYLIPNHKSKMPL